MKPEDKHPEDFCQECGKENVSWYADNDLWNAVMPDDGGILCPQCFEKKAKDKGLDMIFHASRINGGMADIHPDSNMKTMNLTYSHKELQWHFFAAGVSGMNAALQKRGYFITFSVTDDSLTYEFWKAATVSENGDGYKIDSHQVNKGEYQMNDIRLAVMSRYLEDEAEKFMNRVEQHFAPKTGSVTEKYNAQPSV